MEKIPIITTLKFSLLEFWHKRTESMLEQQRKLFMGKICNVSLNTSLPVWQNIQAKFINLIYITLEQEKII